MKFKIMLAAITFKSSSKLSSSPTDRRLRPITTGEVLQFPCESCPEKYAGNQIAASVPWIYRRVKIECIQFHSES